jgi:hypothetical protein
MVIMMKKMTYLIIVMAIAVTAITSCTDFLTSQHPQSFITSGNFYKTKAQMQQAINGAYSSLQDLYGGGTHNFWIVAEERSDNTTFQYNPSDRGTSEFEKADYFELYPAGPLTELIWQRIYHGIAQCNGVLDHVDNAKISDEEKKQITG